MYYVIAVETRCFRSLTIEINWMKYGTSLMWFLFPESTISFIHYHEKAISTLFSKVTLNEKSSHHQTYEKNSRTFYLRTSCHVFISIDITCDLLYSRSSKCHNISPKGDFLAGECYPRFCNRWIFSTLSKETRFSRKQKLQSKKFCRLRTSVGKVTNSSL